MPKREIKVSIPKDMLAKLPLASFPGTIEVIDQSDRVSAAINEISRYGIVGFDTETRPSFRKGTNNKVALMQISTPDKAFLFRLNVIGLTPEMIRFMENPNIVKVGLSIKDDFFVMHRSESFEPQGFIDLQEMVKDYSIIDSSLQRIYAILFNQRISKGQRLSNWEADILTGAQQHYASLDAWACLRIYNHLIRENFKPEQSPYLVVKKEESTDPISF